MLIIHNKIIPFGRGFLAINLFGVIFTKGPLGAVDVNHESIHTAQMREMLYVPYYLFYVLEWLVRIVQYRGYVLGYANISFEREAYRNERNLSYLKGRKRFASLKYLRVKR